MNLLNNLDKNNLHHAYLIEGEHDFIAPQIFEYVEKVLKIKTLGNPDFCHIQVDLLKIKHAIDLREMGIQKSFTLGKKIFVLSINRFSKEAEGVLLKMFEEPIENTHFFIITPDKNILTKTLLSRFYFISSRENLDKNEIEEAEKFIRMTLKSRIDFIKEFIASSLKNEDEDEEDVIEINSVRSKAFKFLNALEYVLHQKLISKIEVQPLSGKNNYFEQLFRVREYLSQQGSPTKTLLESLAITIPVL